MSDKTKTNEQLLNDLKSLKKEVKELREFKRKCWCADSQKQIETMFTNEEIYKMLVENAFDAIYLLRDRHYEYVNPRFSEITGYSFEEMTSPDFDYNVFLPKEHQKTMESRYKARKIGKEIANQYDMQILNKRGEIIDIEVNTKSVGKKGEVTVLGIMRNITERKKVEEKLKSLIVALRISKELTEERSKEIQKLNKKLMDSEKHLKELNASKDKFFSIISHDLRGPFSGFLGLSKTLASDLANLSINEVQEISKDMHDSAEHLFRLLENLLQWSRIQRKAIENNPEMVSIRDIADLCLSLQAINAKQKDITLTNNIDPTAQVYADLNMANTVIRNLISNAVKFTPQGGEIIIEAVHHDKNNIELHIKDNGVGMDGETMNKLFKIDEHITNEGTAHEQGTGLGLILCKELIELNKGKIWVESTLGKGTTFKFTLLKKPVIINRSKK